MTGKSKSLNRFITGVVSNENGEIFELDGFAAVGMDGRYFYPLYRDDTVSMPYGSELMRLPDRFPVLYHRASRSYQTLVENPYNPGQKIYPVAVFNSPGYVLSHCTAYRESSRARILPLFSYGAVGWSNGCFRSAAVRVDRERRQDLRLMKHEAVVAGVQTLRKQMPDNRLCEHLENCALTYGCPAGKNFFLGRFEAPLPTSRICNARCLGCLSLQEGNDISCSQQRIDFTPRPSEIAEVALTHLNRVKEGIVSFGQGCEGDPLLAADAIIPAITLIRKKTSRGTIHMNTNGSQPDTLARLFDAGLDTLRISINSMRKNCYHAYFRPRGYDFEAVMGSVAVALAKKKFVSVNYLNCPGFTDLPEEVAALESFLMKYPIHMIQWRNLNYDPLEYLRAMTGPAVSGGPLGMKYVLDRISERFPTIGFGYFNPSKEKFSRMTVERVPESRIK